MKLTNLIIVVVCRVVVQPCGFASKGVYSEYKKKKEVLCKPTYWMWLKIYILLYFINSQVC